MLILWIDQIGKAQIIGKKMEKYKVKRGLVNVSVVKIDEQTNKIILSTRQISQNPNPNRVLPS